MGTSPWVGPRRLRCAICSRGDRPRPAPPNDAATSPDKHCIPEQPAGFSSPTMAAQWLTLAPAGQDMRGPELTSTLPLAVSCSIDAVRGSFQPFPVIRRTRPQRPLARPERHQQEVRNAAKRIAAAACAAQTAQAAFPCRRLKGADVQDVKQLHVSGPVSLG